MRRVLPFVAFVCVLGFPAAAPAQDRAELATRLTQLPGELARSKKSDAECIDALFLATLVRLPKDAEREGTTKYLARAKDREEGLRGVLFTLINSKEFFKLQGFDKNVREGLEFVNSVADGWEKK